MDHPYFLYSHSSCDSLSPRYYFRVHECSTYGIFPPCGCPRLQGNKAEKNSSLVVRPTSSPWLWVSLCCDTSRTRILAALSCRYLSFTKKLVELAVVSCRAGSVILRYHSHSVACDLYQSQTPAPSTQSSIVKLFRLLQKRRRSKGDKQPSTKEPKVARGRSLLAVCLVRCSL